MCCNVKYILLSKMNLTAINATKIARQIQLCQRYICCKSNAHRALFQKVTCNWLTTTESSLRKSSTNTFCQNNFLRNRIANNSFSIVPTRSFIICLTSSADKSQKLLSQFANVRHFIGKNLSTVSCGTVLDKMAKTNEFRRLPSSVVPKHYNLELKPDLIGFTFTGSVSIKIEVKINLFESFVCMLGVYGK